VIAGRAHVFARSTAIGAISLRRSLETFKRTRAAHTACHRHAWSSSTNQTTSLLGSEKRSLSTNEQVHGPYPSVISPFSSVVPEASIICNSTLACRRSSKNAFPRPLRAGVGILEGGKVVRPCQDGHQERGQQYQEARLECDEYHLCKTHSGEDNDHGIRTWHMHKAPDGEFGNTKTGGLTL